MCIQVMISKVAIANIFTIENLAGPMTRLSKVFIYLSFS